MAWTNEESIRFGKLENKVGKSGEDLAYIRARIDNMTPQGTCAEHGAKITANGKGIEENGRKVTRNLAAISCLAVAGALAVIAIIIYMKTGEVHIP